MKILPKEHKHGPYSILLEGWEFYFHDVSTHNATGTWVKHSSGIIVGRAVTLPAEQEFIEALKNA